MAGRSEYAHKYGLGTGESVHLAENSGDTVSEVTQILNAIGQGDPIAPDELLTLVYHELRRLAAYKMAREAPGQTLQPTALVHEAWLRLGDSDQQSWQNRAHFF